MGSPDRDHSTDYYALIAHWLVVQASGSMNSSRHAYPITNKFVSRPAGISQIFFQFRRANLKFCHHKASSPIALHHLQTLPGQLLPCQNTEKNSTESLSLQEVWTSHLVLLRFCSASSICGLFWLVVCWSTILHVVLSHAFRDRYMWTSRTNLVSGQTLIFKIFSVFNGMNIIAY